MVAMRSCKWCKIRYPLDQMISHPVGLFHSQNCVVNYARKVSALSNKKLYEKKKVEFRKTEKEQKKLVIVRKKALKKRIGKNGYYYNLQTEINYYVKYILRPNDPCYTCGKPRDKSKVFHAGHYMPAKSVDPRRFKLENIRVQCYDCNYRKSGNQAVYRKKLIEEMGLDHVEWLETESNFEPLRIQFPEDDDIRRETSMYRKINKTHRDG